MRKENQEIYSDPLYISHLPTIFLYQYCKSRMTYYSDCGWAPFGWTQEVAKDVGKCGVDMTLTDGKCAYSCPLVSSFCSDQTDWDDDTGKCVSTCDPKAPSPLTFHPHPHKGLWRGVGERPLRGLYSVLASLTTDVEWYSTTSRESVNMVFTTVVLCPVPQIPACFL